MATHPKLTSRAPTTGLRSLHSLGLVAIIGLAPTARVALAESLMTTLFVIYSSAQALPHMPGGSQLTWCIKGVSFLTTPIRAMTPSIKLSTFVGPCQEGEKIAAVSPFVVLDRLNESITPLNILADPCGSTDETISEMTATPASLFREFGAMEPCSNWGRLGVCTPPIIRYLSGN